MIRVRVPEARSAGALIRSLLARFAGESLSLDAASSTVCIDAAALRSAQVAEAVEEWLLETGLGSARVEVDSERHAFMVRAKPEVRKTSECESSRERDEPDGSPSPASASRR